MALEKITKNIIVVSGLPRSGTSLMMQILQSVGIPLLFDDHRPPDKNNPKGYFEYHLVKKIKQNNQWLSEAQGKAVKIISELLYHLPNEFYYKIIFMNRDLNEILISQEKMLKSFGQTSSIDLATMKLHLGKHLLEIDQWLKNQSNMEVLKVSFAHLFSQPEKELQALARFLDIDFDISKAKQVILTDLYRSKK